MENFRSHTKANEEKEERRRDASDVGSLKWFQRRRWLLNRWIVSRTAEDAWCERRRFWMGWQ